MMMVELRLSEYGMKNGRRVVLEFVSGFATPFWEWLYERQPEDANS
jgi:hypothetical protein